MGETPLISIIVPIYNVEKYVRKCLDSLKEQTLKQIEVICIDDGSTGKSGEIAKEYVTTSTGGVQFRLIRHEENRGLSAVRNTGINEAQSDWIMFVDSDDWVEPGFCEIPYNAAIMNNADLVIFGFDRWKNGKEKKSKNKGIVSSGIIDEYTAHKTGDTVAWNKLYKRMLFQEICYPEGRVFEDYAVTHKLVHKSNNTFMLKKKLYHYREHKNSITHTRSPENRRDCLISAIERRNDLIAYGYPIEDGLLCSAAIAFISTNGKDDRNLFPIANRVIEHAKDIPENLSIYQRTALSIWKISPRLFFVICRATAKLRCHI